MLGILIKLSIWAARFLLWAVVWAVLEYAFDVLLKKGLPQKKRPRKPVNDPNGHLTTAVR
jgi:hypothetical protein